MAVFFATLWASAVAFLAANAISFTVKATPVVVFAALFLAEWLCDTTFGKVRLVALMLAAGVLYLDVRNELPIVPTPSPKKS